MSNRLPRFFSSLVCGLAALPAWAAPCDPPAGSADLPRTKTALASHRLSLLVVAPAASKGAETGAGEGTLGARIESTLRALRPDVALDRDSLDNTGQLLSELLPQLAMRLEQRPVQLVLLQAGTAEAFRNTPVSDFGASLAGTLTLAAQDGADVLLIDPDPAAASQASFPTIEALLAQAATRPGVALYAQFRYAGGAGPACLPHGIASMIIQP